MINKKNLKEISILIFLTIFISSFIFIPYLISEKAYVIGWDMRTQYSSFYVSFKNIIVNSIKNFNFPFYSWDYFLGNDYYSSKMFYYQDVFDLLFVFTKLKYHHVVMIQTFIKFVISSCCMYKLLKYKGFKSTFVIIGSLLYTFSSYSLDIIKDPFFHSFCVFVPLYFYTIDKYLLENKFNGFILITIFLIITNYYFFFGLSFFTVFYYIYVYFKNKLDIKQFFIKTLILIGYYFIAVLISSIVLLPSILFLLDNPRLSKSSDFLFYSEIKIYFSILVGLFFPFNFTSNRLNEFNSVYRYVSKYNSVLSVFIFTSSISSILIPYSIIKKNINKIIYIILYLMLLIPFFSSIYQGFSEATFRWLNYFCLINIILMLEVLDEKLDFKLLKKITFIVVIVLIISTPILGYIYNINIFNEYKYHLLICLLTIIAYYFIKNKKYILYFIVFELCIYSYISVYKNSFYSNFDKSFINGVHSVLGENDELETYLKGIDSGFYRVYVDIPTIYWDYSNNLNLDYGFMSVNTYDSTLNYQNIKLNNFSNVSKYLPWVLEIKDEKILEFLNVKYAISTDVNNVPFDKYEIVGSFNDIPIYKNISEHKFVKSYKAYRNYNGINGCKINTCLISDENVKFNGYSNIKEDYVVLKENEVLFGFYSEKNTIVNIPIPFSKGFNIYINGNKVNSFESNGGFLSFEAIEGYQDVEVKFLPNGFKMGSLLSVIGIFLYGCLIFFSNKSLKKS